MVHPNTLVIYLRDDDDFAATATVMDVRRKRKREAKKTDGRIFTGTNNVLPN